MTAQPTVSASAIATLYRAEIINGFDKTQSLLRDTVTTETMTSGGATVFLTNNSAGSRAVTRGLNGEIPARPLNLSRNTVVLTPWHDRVVVNDFNMFSAQGDLRLPMQRDVMATINRQIDLDITGALVAATTTTGAATTGSVALLARAKTMLANMLVPNDGNLTLLCTPAFMNYLMQAPEFSNSQYVQGRSPFSDGAPAWGDNRMMYKWNGMNIIEDPTLPGVGTNAATCYLYHKSAVGHAINTETMEMDMDYNREQRYTWANCTAYMGSALIQSAAGQGVVKIIHDDTGLSS